MTERTAETPTTNESATDHAPIIFYWRPGCPFCSMLRTGLRRAGLSFTEVDIWKDPDAAAFVRSVARGNETVPTVTIGTTTVINPSARKVAELAFSGVDGTV